MINYTSNSQSLFRIIFIYFILLCNFYFAQLKTSQTIHDDAWKTAAKNSQYDNLFKYSIYSSRSLMVLHPEVYLQADSIWIEGMVTVYSGWAEEYKIRDRNDEKYPNMTISNGFRGNVKFDGSEFKWSQLDWDKHRKNSVQLKNLYETNAPFYDWLDSRLPMLWNGLKGLEWKTPLLTLAEAFYFQKRFEKTSCFLLFSDKNVGYVATIENGICKLFDPLNGNEIQKNSIVGNIVLVMDQNNVWYPLFKRDDRTNSMNLKTIVNNYCTENSLPSLSSFENTLIEDLRIGTKLIKGNDFTWALVCASRVGKQWAWQAQPLRQLTKSLFPQRYIENGDSPSDIPYELCAMNMVLTEMGNRLSPATSVLAFEAYKNSTFSLTEAITAVSEKYYKYFGRINNSTNTAWVYGDYFKVWLPTIDDKVIAGIGDCFVEACAVGSALNIANVPNWNVWITNWWNINEGGGHVVAGVYANGEGKTLSNGLYNKNDGQCTDGPLWNYDGRLIFPLVYKPDYGILTIGQVSPSRIFEVPYTNLDSISTIGFIDEIISNEPDLAFANGRDAFPGTSQILASDYQKYITTIKSKWTVFDYGSLVSKNYLAGKITDVNNKSASQILVNLYDINRKKIKSVGSNTLGEFKIYGIQEGDYKLFFSGSYNSQYKYFDKWYNGKNSFNTADLVNIKSSLNVDNIIIQLAYDNKPTVKIVSPLKDSEISGESTIEVSTTDDIGIKKVEFILNRAIVGQTYAFPHKISFNTAKFTNGVYSLIVNSYDTRNQKNSDSTTLKIFNDLPPKVLIASPQNGSIVEGMINILANISDDFGVKTVEIFIDNIKIEEKKTEPFGCSFSCNGLTNGAHTIKFIAEDSRGNKSIDQILIYKSNIPVEKYSFIKAIGGSPSPGKFNFPQGVATDKDGNVYVADRNNYRVQKFSYDGTFLLAFGKRGYKDDEFLSEPYGISASSDGYVYVAAGNKVSKFSSTGLYINNIPIQWEILIPTGRRSIDPLAVAVDNEGNIYVTYMGANLLIKFDLNGNIIWKKQTKGNLDGEFNSPRGVCVDEYNFVYVVDAYNKRIQKFNSSGEFVDKWDLTGNVYTGWPRFWGIASDKSGHIYLCDTDNQRIIKYNLDGTIAKQWGGTWGNALGEFQWPQGIAVGKYGHVYVSDDNHRIQEFTSNGSLVSQWGSQSSLEKGQFFLPVGIAKDKKGNIYVADYYNNRIQKFDANGKFITLWGKLGKKEGEFILPVGIAIDDEGFVYVSELGGYAPPFNARVQKFNSDGEFVKSFGSQGNGDGQFNWPYGITIDKDGFIYVVDFGNSRIQKFSKEGNFISKWGKLGTEEGELYYPRAIAIDKNNNILVSQQGEIGKTSKIQKFTSDGKFILGWDLNDSDGNRGNPYFYGVTVDNFGFVYVSVSSKNIIKKYDAVGNLINQWGGDNWGGGTWGNGEGVFNKPGGIIVNNSSIIVTDTDNNRVQIFDDPSSKTTNIDSENSLPSEFKLAQNYPNPFNPNTIINYELPIMSRVKLEVYNVIGQRLEVLCDEIKESGVYSINWNANKYASGVYIYKIDAKSTINGKIFKDVKKMILIK